MSPVLPDLLSVTDPTTQTKKTIVTLEGEENCIESRGVQNPLESDTERV